MSLPPKRTSGRHAAFWLMLAGLGVSGVITSAVATATNATCDVEVSYSRGFKIETITNPGVCDWTAPAGVSQIDAQLVGGGGGGAFSAAAGGGGGGGQYVRVNSASVTPGTSYQVGVGAGGAGGAGSSSQGNPGADGSDSSFVGVTAFGGEGGKVGTATGNPLGAGGAASKSATVNFGTAVPQASWAGGTAQSVVGTTNISPTCPTTRLGGGGAGSGAVGSSTGVGGAGFVSNFNFQNVTFGGGGGGHRESSSTYNTAATGGAGGGGAGGHALATLPQAGTDGLGGGGGARGGQCGAAGLGSASTHGGAAGGSGQVAIRYYSPEVLSTPTAVGLQSRVELQWTKSQDIFATGYRIVWSTTQSDLADGSLSSRTPITVSSKDTNFYSHTTLTNGLTYYYRVATAFTNPASQTIISSYSDVVSASPAMTRTDVFSVTRNTQYFTVPQGVSWIEVESRGAGAHSTNGSYGTGGTVKALVPVIPGETLNIEVGSKPVAIAGENFWGYNGGGTSSRGITHGGGGGTDIRRGTGIADRILVAGGGGGYSVCSWGGYNNGLTGSSDQGNYSAGGGQSLPVIWPNSATDLRLRVTGSPGVGASGTSASGGGGGGGGGYIGGSSYNCYGGGGGSSWVTPEAVRVQYTGGTNSSDGSVSITYVSDPTPANFRVTALQSQNVLSWDRLYVTSISGVEVYRSTNGTSWTLLATPTGDSYVDSGLTNGVAYQYRIRTKAGTVFSDYTTVVTSTPQFTVTKTFAATGQTEDFVVPAGVNWIQVRANGAAGGGTLGGWGYGGSVTSIIPVTPGEILKINVGTQPKQISSQNVWGFNGGGTSNGGVAQGGGGATDIRRGGDSWSHRIVVAGGGGGRGASSYGGYNNGLSGYQDSGDASPGGGQTAEITWRTNATVLASRMPGSLGQGANSIASGGGGGGGYYGGSTYTSYGGGAGSSYVYESAIATTFTSQATSGDGSLTLTYVNNVVPINVKAIALQNSIMITWDASDFTGLNGYDIFWGTSPNPTVRLTTVGASQLFYEHTGLTNGTQYYYRIKAKTAALASDYSSEVSALPAFMAEQRFSVTRNTQYFTVPQGVSWIEVESRGAGAHSTNGSYGTGGTVKALVPVIPGETLNIEVGSKPVAIAGENFWGYNGGGTSSRGITSGGGGGTDIRRGTGIADRILVAGGGGGYSVCSWGGYNTGLTGSSDQGNYSAGGGQSLPVIWPNSATDLRLRVTGSPGVGASGTSASGGGGGGGGGYIGGSSYNCYGGGGGSSWVTPEAVRVQYTGGTNSSDGSVVIRYPTKAYPDEVRVTPLQSKNVISWKASEVSGLGGYQIYWGTTPNPTTLLVSPAAGATSYEHTNLTHGTTYYYRVAARLGSVESERSAVVSGTPNPTVTKTFAATGQTEDFVVPAGVNWIQVRANGAAGGGTLGGWGYGGSVTSIIPVTPGEILKINVGTQPKQISSQNVWGFNGGGTSNGGVAQGGGGATDIRRGGDSWSHRIVVAGGGGGRGASSYGGFNQGLSGSQDSGDASPGGGQTAEITWRTNATVLASRMPGSLGQGANSIASGGGGGGGYYGGSTYTSYGGGAGSSYVYESAIATTFATQTTSGDGSLTLTYVMNEPVQNLAAIASNRTVDLSWDAHEMTSLAGYRVFGGTSPNPTTLIATTTVTRYRQTSLTNGTAYYYRVVPYYGSILGAYSQDVTATPTSVTVVNFSATGGVQTFQVPNQVSWLQVEALGAGAHSTNGSYGTGGTARASIPVTPGETLNIYVGTKPKTVNNQAVWGFNGGGTSSRGITSGGGGGTDIRRGTGIADRILVAGGGGGYSVCSWGGYNTGLTGSSDQGNYSAGGGQSLPVIWPNSATDLRLRVTGSPGVGASGTSASGGGGGGGGGYIGGSSYNCYGGGGGSSWVSPEAMNVQFTGASNYGDGRVVITYAIDVDAPRVTRVTTPAPSGTYRTGTDLYIDVGFSEPVIVDGSPTLQVNAGTRNPVELSYVAGSGTSTLRFKYTVLAGDVTGPQGLDLASTSALNLNGSVISDPAGNAAIVTLPTPGSPNSLRGDKTLIIDGDVPLPPELVSVSGANRIDLQWTANTEPDLKEYRIYVSTDQENFSQLGTAIAPTTSFSQLVVATGITYYYYITAVDINGNESDRSEVVSWFIATPGLVSVPSLLIPSPTNSQSPTITGVADPGADVLIYDESSVSPQLLGTVRVPSNGKFSFQIAGPLAEGSYSLSARASTSSLVSAKTIIRPLVVDLTAPSLESIRRLNPASERTSDTTLIWRLRFSEEMKNLMPADLSALSTSASVTSARQNPLNRLEWDVAISGGDIGSIRGAVGIALTASAQVTDLAGNALSSIIPTGTVQTYLIDRSNPLVVMSSSAQSLGGLNPSTSISFSIDMDASSNFTVDDITVVGGTLSGFGGSGQTFSATLTATAGFEGTGRLSIRAGVFTSSSGNPNRSSVDLLIPIDMVAPRVVSVDRFVANGAYGVGATVDVVVNLSEPITVSGSPTLLLETGATDRTAVFHSATQSEIIFRYTVQAGDNSTDLNYQSVNALNLAGGTILDAVGNAATLTLPGLDDPQSLKSRASLVVDTTAPSAPGTPTITVVGGRLVTNFINSTNTNITAQASVTAADYTFGGRAELLANGTVVASTSNMTSPISLALGSTTPAGLQALIPEGSVTFVIRVFDAAGNLNTSSAVIRTADFTVPTVTISANVPPPLGNSNFTTRFEWSETVTGFNCSTNVTYQNVSSRTGCSQSGNTYSSTVTPSQNFEGLLRVEMVASNASSGIFDSAGNPAPAATPLSMVLDSKAPSILRVERVTPNGTYGVGREILFRVVFNEPIHLNGYDASFPRVTLNASTSAVAKVASTTSDSIVFSYIVRAGDAAGDLNYSATNALDLGSFTVRDAGNNATSTTLPGTTLSTSLGGSSAIVISGVPPTAPVIQSISATGGNQVTDFINSTNTNLSVQVSFTPSQIVGGRIELLYGDTVVNTATVNAGMTSPQTINLGTTTPSQLQQIVNDGPATFSVVISDVVGNASSVSRALTADFVRPVLTGSVNPARSLGFQEVATLLATSSEGVLYQGSSGCANNSFTIVGGTVSCVVWPQSQSTGSSTLQLSFSPQVQGAWSVTYPAGLLRDRAGNDSMPFSLTGQADTVRPTVLSVTALSANGVYKAGDRISLLVKFDEVVTVNGPASLSLTVAPGTNRDVSYHSGGGTSELRFDYIVQGSDVSSDLNFAGVSALTGSITDRSSNPAVLDLTGVPTLASSAEIVVDGRQPAKPGAPSLAGYSLGQNQGAGLNSLTTNFTVSAQVTSESNIARAELMLNGVVIATDNTASSSDVVSFDLGASSNATIRALVSSVASFTVRMVSVGGNVSPLSDPLTITPDYTRSSMVVAASSLTLSAQAQSTTVNITLSEDSSDFEVSDIVAAGGTLSSFTANSSTSYTVTFTSDGSENFSLRVLAEALTDPAGNPNLPSNVLLGIADTSVPAVSGIRFLTPNGTYKAGDAIRVEIAFSERVTVTGTPSVELGAGDSCAAVPANYLSGSGTTKLVFERIIAAGDNCQNATNTGSTINATGGSIRDSGQNDANLSITSLPNGININADSPAPPLAPIINTDVSSSTQVVDSSASSMNIVVDLNGQRSVAGNIKLFVGAQLFATSSFAVGDSSVTFNLAAGTQLELQSLLEPLIPTSASAAVRAEVSDDDGNFTTSPTTTLTAYWLTTYAEKAAAQQLIAEFTSSPFPTSFSYLAAGVEGVEEDIVNTLNEVLSGMPESDRNDFPADLNAVVAVINSIKAIADDTNGSYTPLTAADLDLICPNSNLNTFCALNGAALGLFNSLIAEGDFADADSASELERLAAFSQKLIAGSPQPSAQEFVDSGFANVTDDDLALIWEVLLGNPAGDAGLDSYQEISTLISDALARKAALSELSNYDTASSSAPTLSTYQTAGVEGVSNSNLALVNQLVAELPAHLSDSIAELNGVVETAERLRNLADGSPDGESTLTSQDLANLGISELTSGAEALALFNSALDGRNLNDVDTIADLSAIAAVVSEVLRLASSDPSNGAAPASTLTEADLASIGITFSAPTTLAQVLFGISDLPNDTSSLDSIQEIESGISDGLTKLAAAGALSNLLNHSSSSQSVPTVSDYSDAGILGVTSNNINLLNSLLESAETNPANTSELQAMVDSANRLMAATDGTDNDNAQLTAQDFANLGLNPAGSGGIDSSLELAIANSLLDQMISSEVDSFNEIAAFASAVEKFAATANATSILDAPTGANRLTLDDLALLGVTGVTAANLETFIAALIGDPGETDVANSVAANLSGLQDLANAAALQQKYDSAALVISAYDGQNTVPTKLDYQNAGVTGVTDDNLSIVNSFVATLDSAVTDTRAELQAIVGLIDRLEAAANGTQDGNANFTQAELESLGISSISPAAVALINAGIDVAQISTVDSAGELGEIADFVTSLLASAATSTSVSPRPTASDFAALGLSGVDSDNLDALLQLIAQSASDGSEIDSLAKLSALVAEAENQASKLQAIDTIGSHTSSDSPLAVSDFLTAGVTSFSPSLVGLISSLIGELPESSRDELAEIQAVSDAANKLRTLADGTHNDGTVLTQAEYQALGFSVSTSAEVSLLNSILDGLNILDFETKSDLDAILAVAERILDKAAGGNDLTIAEFHLIGLPAVTEETLPYLNDRIESSADDGSGADNFAELDALVALAAGDERQAAAIGAITNYGDNGNPAPILSNYIDSQISGVSSANLSLVNSWFDDIAASQSDTVAKIQGIVDAIVAIGLGADTLANDSSQVTNAHLEALGLPTLSSAALAALNDVIDRSSFSSVDSFGELSALIAAVQGVSDFAAGLSTTSPTVSQFEALGLTGVTTANLAFVSQALADASENKNTTADLQAILNDAIAEFNKIAAIQKISGYDGSGSAPTRDDYVTAEVSSVTDGNLAMVNSFIAQRSVAETDTVPEIQSVVDAVNKIRAGVASSLLSPNSLSEADLVALDIAGGADQEFRSLINDILAGKTLADIDSFSELDQIAEIVQALLDTAAGLTPNPALTAADLALVGLTGVTSGNLATVLDRIEQSADSGSGVNQLAKLQAVTNAALNAAQANAAQLVIQTYDGNNTAPTLTDFVDIGVFGVNNDNLSRVNLVLASALEIETNSFAKVQAIVDAISKVESLADGTAGTGMALTTEDLVRLGATEAASLTPTELALVNSVVDRLFLSQFDTPSEVQTVVAAAVKLMVTAANGEPNPPLSTADFVALGLTNVTDAALLMIKIRIEESANDGSGVDSYSELKAIVDAVLAEILAASSLPQIVGFVAGVESSAPIEIDYSIANISLDNAPALLAVNQLILLRSPREIDTRAELQNVVGEIAGSMTQVTEFADGNAAAPNVADFANLGFTNVTSANLSRLNALIAAAGPEGVDTLEKIQDLIAQSLILPQGSGGNPQGPESSEPVQPATSSPAVPTGPESSIEDVVFAETPTNLVVGVNAGSKVTKVRIVLRDSSGRIKQQTVLASDASSALIEITRGRTYNISVYPVLADGTEGKVYETVFNSKPRAVSELTAGIQRSGKVGVSWAISKDFVKHYRVFLESKGKVVEEFTTERTAVEFYQKPFPVRVRVVAIGEVGNESAFSSLAVTRQTAIGAVTARFATRDKQTLISFEASSTANPIYRVFLNGKQVCATRLTSCTIRTRVENQASLRVISSDGAVSPTTNLKSEIAFAGELRFVPNTSRPSLGFSKELGRIAAEARKNGATAVLVTGHANQVGVLQTQSSIRLASARAQYTKNRLQKLLPGVQIFVLNRGVDSPFAMRSSTVNIRAELYLVTK